MTDTDTPIAVITRVNTLLDAFRGGERFTLSTLARRTGLPRSSTHRLLGQLVDAEWLQRNGNHYELGMKLFELGSVAQHRNQVHRSALPVMHELARATGLVVHLAVLDGPDVVYLEKLGGSFSLSLPSRVGGRQPAHRTAVGKALLAHTRVEVSSRADRRSPGTPNAIDDPARLRQELARIREQSVALDREETALGVACVAAAIGDGYRTVGAISVCGPTNLITGTALAGPVQMAALNAWRRVSGARGVDPAFGLPQLIA
ncbi:IclR family transcriptional regulator [Tomitella biformata]|uniref:IclR family transcriptional regulator n=1 Tax=Tomitella biformata TaxID=630403 RepID=UPI0004677D7E|nr:IclR family transcriptional regulator [Tomitella biformata]